MNDQNIITKISECINRFIYILYTLYIGLYHTLLKDIF